MFLQAEQLCNINYLAGIGSGQNAMLHGQFCYAQQSVSY